MQYKIPSEIGSELKINQLFYLTDLLVVLILGGLGFLFRYAVHSSFIWYYGIFWALLMVAWLIRPKTNPKLRMVKALLLAVTSDRITYCAIDKEENGFTKEDSK
ncbi:DUF5592 family protein [Thalassobacillus pellis]|uniref:DUF5592 family protein n=1 Tax=Thalassobacillus pellis TaxID=748008 RepID=UPI0019602513|nr:DUF5592 family protein [Thalassobacillus pellis]MBM7554824.1 hypothetical protein [Thalassobacillus pellis]